MAHLERDAYDLANRHDQRVGHWEFKPLGVNVAAESIQVSQGDVQLHNLHKGRQVGNSRLLIVQAAGQRSQVSQRHIQLHNW